jgi:hypothetical protein
MSRRNSDDLGVSVAPTSAVVGSDVIRGHV